MQFFLLLGHTLNNLLRTVIRLLLLPLIMGLGYEVLKFAGRHDNLFTRIVSAPGMWLQHITVLEPDDGMIECAIKAFVAVIPEEEVAEELSKLPRDEWDAFLDWLWDFEFIKLGLPSPDLVIYLDVPTDFTEAMMRRREADTNTHADIHEQDMQYLATCRRTGRAAAEYYGWTVINCVKDGAMRSIEDIHEELYSLVRKCMEE